MKEVSVCPHDDFDILYEDEFYEIVVRKCKDCGQIEVNAEWADVEWLRSIIADID